jgi:predicted nuclease of predicted toxin-antitoxin system
MRVLVDECLPRQLCQWLAAAQAGWVVATVQDAGWAAMKNGLLLRAANGRFDVLVTADRNMHHQQNFAGLEISVLVFPTNRAKLVRTGVPALLQSLLLTGHGQKAVMDLTAAPDWGAAKLAEAVVEQGITRHVFAAK